MSQHHFETVHGTNRVDVVLGWDRPLHHFFLWVERLNVPCNAPQAPELAFADVDEGSDPCDGSEERSEDFIYHNLDDTASMGAGLSYFRNKLAALGVTVPETMFTQVLRDKALNIGNRHVVYQADGSFEG
ncbi:hypothetical protein [Cupriavidus basilensis]|jgi:hypothetical protein|uniref:hypothetical protein n=1 Tax=Cupriavidus basilensis TaxID=68895 RepID=UPI0020A6246A|nr:hypothetical protein [Cupriavidus basilensis]MCP3024599.1 hypothetical protein [Cupriavidus basilensis]